MSKQTELEWAKNYSKKYPSFKTFTFKDLGVFVNGKFSEPLTLGFMVYSLRTGKGLYRVYGTTSKEALWKYIATRKDK